MCGIAGVVRLDGSVPGTVAVKSMTAALAHRGPDGDGVVQLGAATLGHRRLAVLDLSPAGAQPMTDASGRYHITYNGEIYNYVELRAELEALGVSFRSHGDTEVLLEGFAYWGPAVLDRLNGMFAFAIWDSHELALFAARDRFGEKPFFYTHDPHREVRFASEVKALRAAGLRSSPDRQVLFRFLAYGDTSTAGATFHSEVRQLPPAHVLVAREGRIELRRYWSLPATRASRPGGDLDHVAAIADALSESVRLRLRSDVALGSCLSGGIDSSAIVALVADSLGRDRGARRTRQQQSFSASFPGAPRDETKYARIVAAGAGVDAHEVVPTANELLSELPRLVLAQDEPFSGPSIFAEWKVMELAAANGVTVLLNGQGADEVFAGYPFYFADHWVGLARRGRLGTLRRSMRSHDQDLGTSSAGGMFRDALRRRVPHIVREMRGGPRVPWLHPDFVGSVETRPAPPATGLRASLHDSQTRRMLPHLLRQADRSSMAFSREVRLPFLDHRLVEIADAVPDEAKLRGGVTKWVLREAVRGLVPDSVLARRDKVGFGVPMDAWMRGALALPIRETLTSRRVRDRGFFDPAGLERTLARFESGDDTARQPVWNAWIVETWLRTCVDG